jgi:predicted aspartyl protease
MRSSAYRVVCALLFPLVGLIGAPPANADAPLDAAAIESKVRDAAGPWPDAYRETDETVFSNGTRSIEHEYNRGKDYRYAFDWGGEHAERGRFNGDLWHMNENGQVVLDDPEDDGSPREKLPISATAIHTPVEGYLLAMLDARGRGTKEYIDGATWHVVRRERITADGTIVSTFDDLRADNGRTFAHHVHVDDAVSNVTSDLRVVSYEPGDVPTSEVAMPSPRRALVTFPPGVTSVELPSRFTATQVIVRVMVGNRGLDFMLDTGAAGIFIDETVAKELKLTESDRASAVAAARYDTFDSVVPEMKVGPLDMRDVAVHVAPQGWEMAPGVKTVGLLGFDFLAELGVTIDYDAKRVTVVPGQLFQAPGDPHTIPIDVRVGTGQPQTTVSVNGVRGDRFVLDTGDFSSFMITDYFARHHPDAFKNQTGEQGSLTLQGVGGGFRVRPYKMSDVTISSLDLRDWTGYRIVSQGSYESDEGDGTLGGSFFRFFTVMLDYGGSRVYLVPNQTGRKAMGIK